MRRSSLGTALVVSALSAMVLFSSGVAQAGAPPNVTGEKYSDATSAISGAGLRPVVSTVVGDQKAWPDCLVASQVERTVAPPENSAGSSTDELLVSLNCYSAAATSKSSGYSAASPEAKAIAAAAKSTNSTG
jgi:hypothetical protein